MKALLITNDFPPRVGGIAKWYERICASAPPRSVLVLAPSMPGDGLFDAKQMYKIVRRWAPISRHPMARLIQMSVLLVHTIWLVYREQVDAVHIGQLHLGPIALVLKLFFKKSYVIYLHGGEMAPYMRFGVVRAVARIIVRSARLVVVNSGCTLHHFEAMDIRNPHVTLLTMGVENSRFRPDLDGRLIRARYGLDGQRVVLTVARLDAYKGHDMVIQALKHVSETAGPVRYLIVGRGREERRLHKLAHDLGCSEEVIFAGHVPDYELPSFYAACDVFVMPSRPLPQGDFEGFGIVFLEAGACGKPVIGGRSGGIPEAVIDGVTGILVDPLNVRELSDTLTRLLLNCQEAARLGMQGRLRSERLESAWRETVGRIWSE